MDGAYTPRFRLVITNNSGPACGDVDWDRIAVSAWDDAPTAKVVHGGEELRRETLHGLGAEEEPDLSSALCVENFHAEQPLAVQNGIARGDLVRKKHHALHRLILLLIGVLRIARRSSQRKTDAETGNDGEVSAQPQARTWTEGAA